MITADGYSKDPNIIPEGIAITLGIKQLSTIGIRETLRHFNVWLSDPENTWWQTVSGKPRYEIDHVYVIVLNRLYANQIDTIKNICALCEIELKQSN